MEYRRIKGYDYWITKDLPGDPDEEEPCEYCGRVERCRCEQKISDYEDDLYD